MKTTLATEETFKMIGISYRTLRRWVKAGKIHPVPGSGSQGRRMYFEKSEVEELKKRTDIKTRVEALARIIYACKKHFIKPGFFRYWQFLYGSKRINPKKEIWIRVPACPDKNGKIIDKMRIDHPGSKLPPDPKGAALLLDTLPPIENVPIEIKRWAEHLGKKLSLTELDYIGAIFFVTEHPQQQYSFSEIKVRSKAIEAIKNDRGLSIKDFFPKLQNINTTHKNSVHHLNSPHDKFFHYLNSADVQAVQELVSKDSKTQINMSYIKKDIRSRLKKDKKTMRERKGTPTCNQIAIAIGIHRHQSTRILRRIFNNIGNEDVEILKQHLCLEPEQIPSLWWKLVNRLQRKPLKNNGKRKINPTPAECVECGETLIIAQDKSVLCTECGWSSSVEDLQEAVKTKFRQDDPDDVFNDDDENNV